MKFAKAMIPTPILNTPNFSQVFTLPLPVDDQGLLRAVETVALPETKFEILEECDDHILKVKTADYPSCNGYVDKRFLQETSPNVPERQKKLPSKEKILNSLEESLGLPYIWGGNVGRGVNELLKYYTPSKNVDDTTHAIWSLKGVDCSGLLYEATDGFTPRNTSELLSWGKEIKEEELSPLDLIVWKGHVVIVFDSSTTIESRAGHGVIKRNLQERLNEIKSEKRDYMLRRWYDVFV